MKFFLINMVLFFLVSHVLVVESHWTLTDWQLWAGVVSLVVVNVSGYIEGRTR